MLIYRIALTRFAGDLIASGRAARWNPNDVKMIYTASSRALACLENVVHRSRHGLNQLFSIMTIECADDIAIKSITSGELPDDWTDYDQVYLSQRIGEKWINDGETAILQVPSSIIPEETNYLINPRHKDFDRIRVIKTTPFIFDSRIKL